MFVIPLVVNWLNELPSKLNPIAFTLNLRRCACVHHRPNPESSYFAPLICSAIVYFFFLTLLLLLPLQLHLGHQRQECQFPSSRHEPDGHVSVDIW